MWWPAYTPRYGCFRFPEHAYILFDLNIAGLINARSHRDLSVGIRVIEFGGLPTRRDMVVSDFFSMRTCFMKLTLPASSTLDRIEAIRSVFLSSNLVACLHAEI